MTLRPKRKFVPPPPVKKGKKRKKNPNDYKPPTKDKQGKYPKSSDALAHRVPGSFESGKRR